MYANIAAIKGDDILSVVNSGRLICFNEIKVIINNELNRIVAIVTPDKDIIPDAETLKPAYIVFDNYEIILKWNRSLRFALAVCSLQNKIKNAL